MIITNTSRNNNYNNNATVGVGRDEKWIHILVRKQEARRLCWGVRVDDRMILKSILEEWSGESVCGLGSCG
jgi:hypothetical protein